MNEEESRFREQPVSTSEGAADAGRGPTNPGTYVPGPGTYTEGSAPPPPYSPPGSPAYGVPAAGPYAAPATPGLPNPATAFVLGLLPGVGAMYNGQFAKGIANIAIFAVLVSFSDHVSGIFGIFVAGWIAFMVFDAYETARARRFGLPIPNAFGLNDIGERLGFGPNAGWQSPFHSAPGASASAPPAGYHVDPQGNVYPPPPAAAAAPQPYTDASPPLGPYAAAPYAAAEPLASHQPPSPYVYAAAPPYWPVGQPGPADPPYSYAPYAPPPMPDWTMPPPPPRSAPFTDPASVRPATELAGVPAGALWLIGLGLLALLGSVRGFRFVNGEFTVALLLIAFGAFLAIRKWQQMDVVSVEGTAQRRWLLINNMRGPAIFVVAGALELLQAARVLNWGQTWPFLLIFLGSWILIERISFNRVAEESYHFAAGPAPAGATGAEPRRGGFAPSVVPSASDTGTDKEGR